MTREDEAAELGRFYERWAADRADNVLVQEYVRLADEWKWATLRPLIARFAPDPRRILELGCGSGDMLQLAHNSFPEAELYGIDLSERMIEMAGKRLPGAKFMVGDIRVLDEMPFAVDLALAVDILEHLTDPVPAARALGSHSTFVAFKIPLERKLLRFGLPRPQLRGTDHPAGHLHFWTLGESRALLVAAGFQVLAETCADPPEPVRYHPGTMTPAAGDASARKKTFDARLRRMHRASDVAFEKWSCKHSPGIHRVFYGSNHFAICRRSGTA